MKYFKVCNSGQYMQHAKQMFDLSDINFKQVQRTGRKATKF